MGATGIVSTSSTSVSCWPRARQRSRCRSSCSCFAYAVLGPLHYLTEISWIHDRGYFVDRGGERRRKTLWLVLVGVTLATMLFGLVRERLLHNPVSPVWEIGLFYLVVVAAGLLALRINETLAAAIVALAGAGLILFAGSPAYGLLAFLVITIIHVLVFHRRVPAARRAPIAQPLGASLGRGLRGVHRELLRRRSATAAVGAYVRQSYEPFETLNLVLIGLLGLGPGSALREIYQSPAGGAVMLADRVRLHLPLPELVHEDRGDRLETYPAASRGGRNRRAVAGGGWRPTPGTTGSASSCSTR
jgi:hypothetical protein